MRILIAVMVAIAGITTGVLLGWGIFNKQVTSLNAQVASPATEAVSSTVGINETKMKMLLAMRKLWQDQIVWTRMTILNQVDGLESASSIASAMQNNNDQFRALLKAFYSNQQAQQFDDLLNNSNDLMIQYIQASRSGNGQAASSTEQSWVSNADQMATFLNSINPNLSASDLQTMLRSYLDLTKQEIAARVGKHYDTDVSAYEKIEDQAMTLADTISIGIIKQSPETFR